MLYPEPDKKAGTTAEMLDHSATFPVAAEEQTTALTRRRALFAALVATTMAAILWLASVAVPPRSFGAIAFLVLFAVTLPWSVIGFWNAVIGFLIMRLCRDPAAVVNPLVARIRGDEPVTSSTAILMCIRNESPDQVVRNLQPLLEDLVEAQVAHLFHVYLLSDSSDPRIIAAETSRFEPFIAKWSDTIPVTYRSRLVNTAFKAGNIREFCDRWGHNHTFALTLDADSFIPAQAVLRLLRIMQENPTLGILQSLIVGMPSISPLARVFQFGMRLGMRSYTLGATWWQGDCGPYWGHNAILRLAPFIAHCRLPVLTGNGPLAGPVLSHDQVEAVLMRRAGYEVRVLAQEGLSWEENPPTLVEFIRRDLRWCQGNMQYWRLLKLRGLKAVSRFQLIFAILMYLNSPAWMAMTALGVILLALSDTPSMPHMQIGVGAGTALFAIMILMTLTPKIATIIDVMLRVSVRRSYGGASVFVLNILGETLFITLLTPILALAHTIFLARLFVFRRGSSWTGQLREIHVVPWRLAFEKFWPQTLVGFTILAVVANKSPGDLGFALLGTAGLILAVPFAVATASPLIGTFFAWMAIARIPEENEPPLVLLPLHLPAIEASPRSVARIQS
jgi:membrane glycosyltransferase